jgi:hypothetical protein
MLTPAGPAAAWTIVSPIPTSRAAPLSSTVGVTVTGDGGS